MQWYMQQVLAFSTQVHNIGCAPFVIGVPSGYEPGCPAHAHTLHMDTDMDTDMDMDMGMDMDMDMDMAWHVAWHGCIACA